MKQPDSRRKSVNWNGPLRAVLLLALALPLLGGPKLAPASSHASPQAHPALLQIAAQTPHTNVSVIVQKSTTGTAPEAMVTRLGGLVTKELSIINAFAAEMPAQAAVELAKSSQVRWVSPNAPVQQSSETDTFTTWANDVGAIPLNSTSSSFNSAPVLAGRYIWFSLMTKVNWSTSGVVTLNYEDATVQFTANGTEYKLDVPDATLTFDPAATSATTLFDQENGTWATTAPVSQRQQEVFLTALAFKVPANLPGNIGSVTWSGRFTTGNTTVSVNTWRWSAAVYANLASDYNALGVKPCRDDRASQYHNNDLAGTPENFKLLVLAGARGGGLTDYIGAYSPGQSLTPTVLFKGLASILDTSQGPLDTFGFGSSVRGSFTGFSAETTPGNSITRVEVALRTYVPQQLDSGDDPRLWVSVNGQSGSSITVNRSSFNSFIGQANAGTLYVDITSSRNWQWGDFDQDLQLTIDQTRLDGNSYIYYDAVGLRVTSAPGTDNSQTGRNTSGSTSPLDTSRLANVYNQVVRATDVWNGEGHSQGQGITVAVVDSGIVKTKDLQGKLIDAVNFSSGSHTSSDAYGHGTFVAGVLAGTGKSSAGKYMGIAPKAGLINVRVSDADGMATEADVVSGLQWISQNKDRYNIRVVNLSLNSSMAQSYHTSPMCAAVEVLWFSGITVVVSAGNNGTSNLFPPANDPFVITVGATNDRGTRSLADDTVSGFSAYGTVDSGVNKPDLVAPGTNIIALLPQHSRTQISREHPANRVNAQYFRMSGTSVAAPMVSGAVSLLLQREPNLTPDQVKYRLKATAVNDPLRWPGYDPLRAGAGYLDIYAAVNGGTTQSANTGVRASMLLWTGNQPITWGSVNWNSVNWNSVNWNSVNWNSVNWNSVNWNSDYWDQ